MRQVVFLFALLVGCNISREQVAAMETKIAQTQAVVKSGGEYAKATITFFAMIKEQGPKLKESFPLLAPFIDKLTVAADEFSTKGQVVIDAAIKASVVLGEVKDILGTIKESIPGGVDAQGNPISIPWYTMLIGLVLGAGKKILTGGLA